MPQTPLATTVGLIGLGQMARALATGWARRLDPPPELIGFDPHEAARAQAACQIPTLKLANDNNSVVSQADVVFLAVKPQVLPDVCQEIGSTVAASSAVVVSIAAGVDLPRLESLLGTRNLVRVMPNTPCLVGAGASGLAARPEVGEQDRDIVERLMAAVGICHWLPERLLDAVTGLSGSGPAFVFVLIEALADGGVRMGLPRDVALSLATQTVYGSAKLLNQEGGHPGELKDRVASPGGTTIAGLEALEQRGVRAGMMAAVAAATRRATELNDSS